MRRTHAVLALLALAVPLAACGDDDAAETPDPTTTSAAPTTASTAVDLTPYDEAGPYAAGTTSFALADGRRVVAWYPADPESVAGGPREVFDIASLLSPELQAQVPAESRPQYEIDAYPGAAPATDGPYPVVLFSHGFAGFPEQSADLTTHLAEWGFVVIAPNHVERSLDGLLGVAAKDVPRLENTEVLGQALDAAVAQSTTDTSPLSGLLDTEHVAVTGHSAGAGAAYAFASADTRIDSFIAYSVGFRDEDEDGEPDEELAVPSLPSMVMLGEDDGIIPADSSREVFDTLAPPRYLVEIADAGHLVFSDLCLIGQEQGGIIGIVEEIGLPIPENLKALGSDGCQDDALDPADAFAAINDLSVDFLRSTLGVTALPVGLDDPAIAEQFTTADITVTADR